MRQSALAYFDHGAEQRSPWRRAMAFAGLGAAEVLDVDPRHGRARDLLADAVTTIGPLGADPRWPWPEPRLAYANAVLPEALIAAGQCAASGPTSSRTGSAAALAAGPGDRRRAPLADPGRRLPVPATTAAASTSNRSRSRRWPTPAPGPRR